MVDGVADNDNFFTSASGIPSEFAIQEFKVPSGLCFGRVWAGISQIKVAIKSGTNQWHRHAYDYLQDDALNQKSRLAEEQFLFEGGAVPKV